MKLARVILSVAMFGLLGSIAYADNCGCDSGCGNGKVCKLECTTKTIKVTCWGCECEDKCVPCPSQKQCTHCEPVCKPKCGDCCNDSRFCKFRWTQWCAGTANKITVKKLIRYEVEKEVPSYRWVVVEGCGCGSDSAVPEAPTKPAPAAARIGDVYPLTGAELDQIPAMMARLPKGGNVVRTAAVEKVAPKTVTKRPASSQPPWSLFSK